MLGVARMPHFRVKELMGFGQVFNITNNSELILDNGLPLTQRHAFFWLRHMFM